MIEPDIVAEISSIFSGRVYADTAPAEAARPFCIFQMVGGRPSNTFCGDTDKQNARVQFWVWAETRASANTLMRSLADALTGGTLKAVSLGPLTATYDDITRTYGAQQDFSIWWDTTAT